MFSACLAGENERVSSLLAMRADPNERRNSRSPLHISSRSGSLSCVKALVDWGADVDTLALAFACTAPPAASAKCLRLLLTKKECTSAGSGQDPMGQTWSKDELAHPLGVACEQECVQVLLETGAPTDGIKRASRRLCILLARTESWAASPCCLLVARAAVHLGPASGRATPLSMAC